MIVIGMAIMVRCIGLRRVRFALASLALVVFFNVQTNGQSSALPELCQQCYFDNSTPDAIVACLQQYNCTVDIPVDSGAVFLLCGAAVLLCWSFKRYRLVGPN